MKVAIQSIHSKCPYETSLNTEHYIIQRNTHNAHSTASSFLQTRQLAADCR